MGKTAGWGSYFATGEWSVLDKHKVQILIKLPPPERINATSDLIARVESWLEGAHNSYRVHSGCMSHSSSQLHDHLDNYIVEELKGAVQIGVKGFDKFFEVHLHQLNIPVPSNHTISTWLTKGEKTFEGYGKEWFAEFSGDAAALDSNRFYYGSGGTYLKDAYHQALRKCDIFLQQRLPDVQHECHY